MKKSPKTGKREKKIRTVKELLEDAKKLNISPEAKAAAAKVIANAKKEGTYPY